MLVVQKLLEFYVYQFGNRIGLFLIVLADAISVLDDCRSSFELQHAQPLTAFCTLTSVFDAYIPKAIFDLAVKGYMNLCFASYYKNTSPINPCFCGGQSFFFFFY